jgi:hypothetical protein
MNLNSLLGIFVSTDHKFIRSLPNVTSKGNTCGVDYPAAVSSIGLVIPVYLSPVSLQVMLNVGRSPNYKSPSKRKRRNLPLISQLMKMKNKPLFLTTKQSTNF